MLREEIAEILMADNSEESPDSLAGQILSHIRQRIEGLDLADLLKEIGNTIVSPCCKAGMALTVSDKNGKVYTDKGQDVYGCCHCDKLWREGDCQKNTVMHKATSRDVEKGTIILKAILKLLGGESE